MGNLTIITSKTLPPATVGVDVDIIVEATGGAKPYVWACTVGPLPDGLTLDSATGRISGNLTTSSPEAGFTFVLSVTDNNGVTFEESFTLVVSTPLQIQVEYKTFSTKDGIRILRGQTLVAGDIKLTVPGASEELKFTIDSTSKLPDGLSLTDGPDKRSASITGKPTSNQSTSLKINVVAPASHRKGTILIIIWFSDALTLGELHPAAAHLGQHYTADLTAEGSVGIVRFKLAKLNSPNDFPKDITLNSPNPAHPQLDGTISEKEAVGTHNFTLEATDETGISGTKTYTITIAKKMIVKFGKGPAAVAALHTTYTDTVSAENHDGAVTYTKNDPSKWPVGLDLNPNTGVISGGALIEVGNYTLSVKATDGDGDSAIGTCALKVGVAPSAIIQSMDVNPGENRLFPLTRGATGAPFISAKIENAPKGVLQPGNLAHGKGTIERFQLRYQSNKDDFDCSENIYYSLQNEFGVSPPVAVQIHVKPVLLADSITINIKGGGPARAVVLANEANIRGKPDRVEMVGQPPAQSLGRVDKFDPKTGNFTFFPAASWQGPVPIQFRLHRGDVYNSEIFTVTFMYGASTTFV